MCHRPVVALMARTSLSAPESTFDNDATSYRRSGLRISGTVPGEHCLISQPLWSGKDATTSGAPGQRRSQVTLFQCYADWSALPRNELVRDGEKICDNLGLFRLDVGTPHLAPCGDRTRARQAGREDGQSDGRGAAS